MNKPIELSLNLENFFPNLKTKKKEDATLIWDVIWKKWLVLTPEETVRQLLIQYLIKIMNIPISRISTEKGLKVNSRSFRYDLLIYDSDFQPLILVECKASSVPLSTKTFEQAANYNSNLKVPYILVSNGPNAFIAKIDFEKKTSTFLSKLPNH